ncbi:hypothetical protein AVEN_170226-1 [Araneus ventricosus]|uniref:Uncharacterized protein n=1 Tax=Araneus ventricosus TaxID=182803 RepID=A0A4Y2RI50_ARAVE|nr:hypothetical protein AVEN_170226-1 [Araneus ventricosus]
MTARLTVRVVASTLAHLGTWFESIGLSNRTSCDPGEKEEVVCSKREEGRSVGCLHLRAREGVFVLLPVRAPTDCAAREQGCPLRSIWRYLSAHSLRSETGGGTWRSPSPRRTRKNCCRTLLVRLIKERKLVLSNPHCQSM